MGKVLQEKPESAAETAAGEELGTQFGLSTLAHTHPGVVARIAGAAPSSETHPELSISTASPYF
jgi:hypothetical protein